MDVWRELTSSRVSLDGLEVVDRVQYGPVSVDRHGDQVEDGRRAQDEQHGQQPEACARVPRLALADHDGRRYPHGADEQVRDGQGQDVDGRAAADAALARERGDDERVPADGEDAHGDLGGEVERLVERRAPRLGVHGRRGSVVWEQALTGSTSLFVEVR